MNPNDLLTLTQAARLVENVKTGELGVSRQRMAQFVEEGRLPVVRIGPWLFVRRADLEAFAAQERREGRPPESQE